MSNQSTYIAAAPVLDIAVIGKNYVSGGSNLEARGVATIKATVVLALVKFNGNKAV